MAAESVRLRYADEIAAITGVRSQALLSAFARVPREHFLGPGPWRAVVAGGPARFQMTEVSDPAELYHDVAVFLDQSRNLTNGNPGTIAPWLNALNLFEGDSVFHLGCGTGYYSAVMAEVVGPKGRVTAVEIDPGLAARARDCLSAYSNVDVIEGDGAAVRPGLQDAILVHAGVTHPTPGWLDSLKPGGNLLAPLTFDFGVPHVGKGFVLHVERNIRGFAARFLPTPIMIYSCSSVRNSNIGHLLGKALASGGMSSVQSLRRDNHLAGADCWVHAEEFCISTAAIGGG